MYYQDDVAYEEREYDGGKFASVELTGKPFDEALNGAVLKILKYVGGSNDQGEKLYRPTLSLTHVTELYIYSA